MNLLQKLHYDSNHLVPTKPVLILLFSSIPSLDIARISREINNIEPLKKATTFWPHGQSTGVISFDNHRIQLTIHPHRLSNELSDYIINSSQWSYRQKRNAFNHQAYAICVYKGRNNNTVEKYIALYKTANAFVQEHLIGIINEPSWIFQPIEMIPEIVKPEPLKLYRESVPLILLTGFVKIKQKRGIWFLTKGNSLFGLNDLAYFGDKMEVEAVYQVFKDIFYYMYTTKIKIKSGHILRVGKDSYLKFTKATPEQGFLNNLTGTLIIEKILISPETQREQIL